MGEPTSKRFRPRTLALIIIALAGAGILAHRAWQSGFDWHEFWGTFVDLDWMWLTLSLLAIALTYVGRALRWAVLMRPVKPHPSIRGLLSATVIGFTAVVLFGRPGEIVRPYLIASREKVPFSSQLAAWFLERVYDLLAVIIILGIGLSLVHPGPNLSPAMTWLLRAGGNLAGAFGFGCLVLLFLIHRFSDWTEQRLLSALTFLPEHTYTRVSSALRSFLDGMRSTGNFGFVLRICLYTLMEWVLICLCFYCVLKALPETSRLSPGDALAVLGCIAFGSIVQIPGVGGGMQIVAIMVLTELFGLAMEPATGAAVLLWFVSFSSIVPVGLLVAFLEGVNWRKLKHLEQTPAV